MESSCDKGLSLSSYEEWYQEHHTENYKIIFEPSGHEYYVPPNVVYKFKDTTLYELMKLSYNQETKEMVYYARTTPFIFLTLLHLDIEKITTEIFVKYYKVIIFYDDSLFNRTLANEYKQNLSMFPYKILSKQLLKKKPAGDSLLSIRRWQAQFLFHVCNSPHDGFKKLIIDKYQMKKSINEFPSCNLIQNVSSVYPHVFGIGTKEREDMIQLEHLLETEHKILRINTILEKVYGISLTLLNLHKSCGPQVASYMKNRRHVEK